MKRILIYGACHAQVLRDLLSRVLPADAFELSLLVNFQLIASGAPFPYADLRRYDTVIYSPIENHGLYNTDYLRDACAAIGLDCIPIPWLEWHGYCPGAQKGAFMGRHQWHYKQLHVLAENFTSFEAFYQHVVENFPDDQTIHGVFENTLGMMRASEERHEMQIRISDFIVDQFRTSRLFLISDHPSLKIYKEIIAQLLALLKLPFQVVLDSPEPQGEIRTPILPRVARELGLQFSDPVWVDHAVLPNASCDLRTYLRLYYYPSGVILAPLDNARIFGRHVPGSKIGFPAAWDTRLFAQPANQKNTDELQDYELLEILNGPQIASEFAKTFAINPNDWRSTWTF